MTYEDFMQSLLSDKPSPDLNALHVALWHAGKSDPQHWEAAHNIVQAHEGEKDFDHLHAYLHRAEGDEWNAGYWYRRAGVNKSTKNIEEEFIMLVKTWL